MGLVSMTIKQWSFRVGTRGNAVPIVKIPLERMGTAFPLLSYGENAYILLKMHFAVQKDVFLTLKYGVGGRGATPDPAGQLTTLERGHPSQTPPRSAPSALRFTRLRRLEQFWRSHCC